MRFHFFVRQYINSSWVCGPTTASGSITRRSWKSSQTLSVCGPKSPSIAMSKPKESNKACRTNTSSPRSPRVKQEVLSLRSQSLSFSSLSFNPVSLRWQVLLKPPTCNTGQSRRRAENLGAQRRHESKCSNCPANSGQEYQNSTGPIKALLLFFCQIHASNPCCLSIYTTVFVIRQNLSDIQSQSIIDFFAFFDV